MHTQPFRVNFLSNLRTPHRRESRVSHSIFLDVVLNRPLPLGPIVVILLRNLLLERTVELRLLEKLPKSLEHASQLGAGLPGIRLEEAEADVAQVVVRHVGVVDARAELDHGRLEGVVGREGQDQSEPARVVGCLGGRLESDVPGVDGFVGRQRDGEALGRVLGDFSEFLKRLVLTKGRGGR